MTKVFECTDCGSRTFYEKQRCLDCGADAFRDREPGVGRLQAITSVHVTRNDVREPNRLGLASFAGNASIIAKLETDIERGDAVSLAAGRGNDCAVSATTGEVRLVAYDESTR